MNFPTTNDDDDISAEPRFTDRDGDKVTPLRLLLFSFFPYTSTACPCSMSLLYMSTYYDRRPLRGKGTTDALFYFILFFFCQMNRMSHLSRATSIRLQPIATQQVNLDKI